MGLSFMDFAERVKAMSVRDGRERFRSSCEYAYDFCYDFAEPPLDRSPRSWADLAATLNRWGACDEACEGAKAAWLEFQRWKIEEHEDALGPRSRMIRLLDEFLLPAKAASRT